MYLKQSLLVAATCRFVTGTVLPRVPHALRMDRFIGCQVSTGEDRCRFMCSKAAYAIKKPHSLKTRTSPTVLSSRTSVVESDTLLC